MLINKIYNLVRYGDLKPSRARVMVMQNYRLQKKNKIIFIHIPKAAGISVHKGLFGFDTLGHLKFSDYQKYLEASKINDFRTVTFVRNPYNRLVSSYFYLKNGGRGDKLDLEYQDIIAPYKTFQDFVMLFLSPKNIYSLEHLIPQVEWLYNEEGQLNIDFIGRFENLENDFGLLKDKWVKSATSLMHLNKTKESQKTLFTAEMLTVINRLYFKDFQELNYPLKTQEFSV